MKFEGGEGFSVKARKIHSIRRDEGVQGLAQRNRPLPVARAAMSGLCQRAIHSGAWRQGGAAGGRPVDGRRGPRLSWVDPSSEDKVTGGPWTKAVQGPK